MRDQDLPARLIRGLGASQAVVAVRLGVVAQGLDFGFKLIMAMTTTLREEFGVEIVADPGGVEVRQGRSTGRFWRLPGRSAAVSPREMTTRSPS
jgi:hypothetical protein